MTGPILEAHHLSFEYAPERLVIRDLSLSVNPGTLCAVIGSNGSGKSTLVRLFAGILKPTAGDILVDGTSLRVMPRHEAAKQLAYVPQSSTMVFPFTSLEVVLTGRSPYRPPFRFENENDRGVATEALAMVEAVHLAERPVTALSGGEQQLVAVARSLAQQPKCLLLDEPSSSLDLRHRAALMRTLVRLRDTLGLTICVVTHDLHLIDSAFDRVMALRNGRFVADGPPKEVLTEASLAEIYEDPTIRTHRFEGRTLVWCD
jgi:iron complex transport system ATP-binding protein